MPGPRKRDSAYFLDRIRREQPAVYDDFRKGLYPSVAAARRAANMISARTPLHELKNSWTKATSKERRAFLIWAGGGAQVGPRAPPIRPVAVDGHLQSWAIARIRHIMTTRRIKMGTVMSEMRFKTLDASLGRALHGTDAIRPDVVVALASWLSAHRGIK